jgi:hypothetical protein
VNPFSDVENESVNLMLLRIEDLLLEIVNGRGVSCVWATNHVMGKYHFRNLRIRRVGIGRGTDRRNTDKPTPERHPQNDRKLWQRVRHW